MKISKLSAGKVSTTTLDTELFSSKVDAALVSQAIRVYLMNQRQGSVKKKNRSDVDITKKKIYKQKGTGNARHGSRNAPIFVGGGLAHAPNGEQNWSRSLSTTMKRKALHAALTHQAEAVCVCDELEKVTGKTAEVVAVLSPVLEKSKNVLLIVDQRTPEIIRATRNIESVVLVSADRVTALDVAQADAVVISSGAVKSLESRVISAK